MATSPTLESRIRINDDVLFQELHGEGVLLNLKTGVYFGLDPVGRRIWQLAQEQPKDLAVALTHWNALTGGAVIPTRRGEHSEHGEGGRVVEYALGRGDRTRAGPACRARVVFTP